MWCGKQNDVILVQTGDGGIYRSKDRGGSWKKLKSLMMKVGEEVADQNQDVRIIKFNFDLSKDWESS